MTNQIKQHQFTDTVDMKDVPPGKMKHVEIDEVEILLANSGGNVYALCDRCRHERSTFDGYSEWKGCNMPDAWC